ncbi:hypothetical protein JCM10449v2_005895 [Rhodotorula kratochvilovae]
MLALRSAFRPNRAPVPRARALGTLPPRPPSYSPDGSPGADPSFRGSKTRIANLDERSVLVVMAFAAAMGVGWWYVGKEPEARKEYERIKEGLNPSSSTPAKE